MVVELGQGHGGGGGCRMCFVERARGDGRAPVMSKDVPLTGISWESVSTSPKFSSIEGSQTWASSWVGGIGLRGMRSLVERGVDHQLEALLGGR